MLIPQRPLLASRGSFKIYTFEDNRGLKTAPDGGGGGG